MTDYMAANWIVDIFRTLFGLLDRVVYWLLGIMYQILFNVASADIFSNETIRNFYSRIQLIIGVFMLFKLAVSIIQGIINPDSFTDKKSGFSNVITRVIFALVLLTVITPINIPAPQNEYERQLNNNGLLFGTLYSLQTRILENNTLGRLILGTTDNSSINSPTSNKLEEMSNIFSSTILKGFVRINIKPEDERPDPNNDDETNSQNWICGGDADFQKVVDKYAELDISPNEVLSLINYGCVYNTNGSGFWDMVVTFLGGNRRYGLAYMPIISTIVAAIFVYILLGEIITIAIRTLKLAVLRLLAPIPIISYIDPKSEKDGAFGGWVKALTSTYLELFIHLAVIYFIIFLIQDMIVNGIVIDVSSGPVGIISFIFIMIGLFFFIRQAPKFIMDVLGVKSMGANVGLAALMGGTAMLGSGEGARGFATGFLGGARDTIDAYNQGKAAPLGAINTNYQNLAEQIRTGNDKARGGFYGRMQDYAEYQAREGAATRMGYGKRNLAIADAQSKMWQGLLSQRDNELDDAKLELDRFTKTNERTATNAAWYDSEYDRLLNNVRAARTAKANVELHYQKSSKQKDKIEKQRAGLRVNPYARDTVYHTYRSEETAVDDYSSTSTVDGGTHINNVDNNFESAAQDVNPYKQ